VIIASADGRLRFIDLITGKETWKYEVGSPVSSTPAVTSNLIVVCAEDGRIYGFGIAKKIIP
jgi:outer membrane protein assembly factor BamB